MRTLRFVGALLGASSWCVLAPGATLADSAAAPVTRSFRSANGRFELTVDPHRGADGTLAPQLTLREGERIVWRREPGDFEDFRYPLHAVVADDGAHLVFGGTSVHNVGHHEEGLRLYRADGTLVRFVSRRDLPPGFWSVSTAHWYDAARTRAEGQRLHFFTPCRREALVFDLVTGDLAGGGALAAGQGDDSVRQAHMADNPPLWECIRNGARLPADTAAATTPP